MHRYRVMNGCPRILNRRSHKFDFIGSLTASFQERVLDQETWIILEFRNILGNLSWAEKVWWSQSELLNPAIKFPSNASLIQNEIWISFEVRIKLILPRFSALPKSRLSGLQKEMDNDENADSRSMPLEPFCWNSGSRIIVRQAQCSEKWQRVEKRSGQWWKHSVKVSFSNCGKLYLEKQLAPKSDNGPKKWHRVAWKVLINLQNPSPPIKRKLSCGWSLSMAIVHVFTLFSPNVFMLIVPFPQNLAFPRPIWSAGVTWATNKSGGENTKAELALLPHPFHSYRI